jgi:hypothetical protein
VLVYSASVASLRHSPAPRMPPKKAKGKGKPGEGPDLGAWRPVVAAKPLLTSKPLPSALREQLAQVLAPPPAPPPPKEQLIDWSDDVDEASEALVAQAALESFAAGCSLASRSCGAEEATKTAAELLPPDAVHDLDTLSPALVRPPRAGIVQPPDAAQAAAEARAREEAAAAEAEGGKKGKAKADPKAGKKKGAAAEELDPTCTRAFGLEGDAVLSALPDMVEGGPVILEATRKQLADSDALLAMERFVSVLAVLSNCPGTDWLPWKAIVPVREASSGDVTKYNVRLHWQGRPVLVRVATQFPLLGEDPAVPGFPVNAPLDGPELWPAVLWQAWLTVASVASGAWPLVEGVDESSQLQLVHRWAASCDHNVLLECLTGYSTVPAIFPTDAVTLVEWMETVSRNVPLNCVSPNEHYRNRLLEYEASVIRWRRAREVCNDKRRLREVELIARAGFQPNSTAGMKRAAELGIVEQARAAAAQELLPPDPPAFPPVPVGLLPLGSARTVLTATREAIVTASGGSLVPGECYAVIGFRIAPTATYLNGLARPYRATDATRPFPVTVSSEPTRWVLLAGPTLALERPVAATAVSDETAEPFAPPSTEAKPAGSCVAVGVEHDPTDAEVWVRLQDLADLFSAERTWVALAPPSRTRTAVLARAEPSDGAPGDPKKAKGKAPAKDKKAKGKAAAEPEAPSGAVAWAREGEAVRGVLGPDTVVLLEPHGEGASEPVLTVHAWAQPGHNGCVELAEACHLRALLSHSRTQEESFPPEWSDPPAPRRQQPLARAVPLAARESGRNTHVHAVQWSHSEQLLRGRVWCPMLAAPDRLAISVDARDSPAAVLQLQLHSPGWRVALSTRAQMLQVCGLHASLVKGVYLPGLPTLLAPATSVVCSQVVSIGGEATDDHLLAWTLRGDQAHACRCFTVHLSNANVVAHSGSGGVTHVSGGEVALVALAASDVPMSQWALDIASTASVSIEGEESVFDSQRGHTVIGGATPPNRDGVLWKGVVSLSQAAVEAVGGAATACALTSIHAVAGAPATVRPDVLRAIQEAEPSIKAVVRDVAPLLAGGRAPGWSPGAGEVVLELLEQSTPALVKARAVSDRSGSALLMSLPTVSSDNVLDTASFPDPDDAAQATSRLLEGWRPPITETLVEAATDPSRADIGGEEGALTISLCLRLKSVPRGWQEAPPFETVSDDSVQLPTDEASDRVPWRIGVMSQAGVLLAALAAGPTKLPTTLLTSWPSPSLVHPEPDPADADADADAGKGKKGAKPKAAKKAGKGEDDDGKDGAPGAAAVEAILGTIKPAPVLVETSPPTPLALLEDALSPIPAPVMDESLQQLWSVFNR